MTGSINPLVGKYNGTPTTIPFFFRRHLASVGVSPGVSGSARLKSVAGATQALLGRQWGVSGRNKNHPREPKSQTKKVQIPGVTRASVERQPGFNEYFPDEPGYVQRWKLV